MSPERKERSFRPVPTISEAKVSEQTYAGSPEQAQKELEESVRTFTQAAHVQIQGLRQEMKEKGEVVPGLKQDSVNWDVFTSKWYLRELAKLEKRVEELPHSETKVQLRNLLEDIRDNGTLDQEKVTKNIQIKESISPRLKGVTRISWKPRQKLGGIFTFDDGPKGLTKEIAHAFSERGAYVEFYFNCANGVGLKSLQFSPEICHKLDVRHQDVDIKLYPEFQRTKLSPQENEAVNKYLYYLYARKEVFIRKCVEILSIDNFTGDLYNHSASHEKIGSVDTDFEFVCSASGIRFIEMCLDEAYARINRDRGQKQFRFPFGSYPKAFAKEYGGLFEELGLQAVGWKFETKDHCVGSSLDLEESKRISKNISGALDSDREVILFHDANWNTTGPLILKMIDQKLNQ